MLVRPEFSERGRSNKKILINTISIDKYIILINNYISYYIHIIILIKYVLSMAMGYGRIEIQNKKTTKIQLMGRGCRFASLAMPLGVKNEWFCYLLTLNRFSVKKK